MLLDLIFLYFLGLCGWALFRSLNLPVPALLGTVTCIGILRISGLTLPEGPETLLLVIQLFLGFFAGSKLTGETINKFREIITPALIIISWTIIVMFLLGFLLWKFTFIDAYSSLLASCVAGLTQMVILGLAIGADVTVITVLQVFRLVMTLVTFPIIIKIFFSKNLPKKSRFGIYEYMAESYGLISLELFKSLIIKHLMIFANTKWKSLLFSLIKKVPIIILIFSGGLLFELLGVPAGAMVGSMITVAVYALIIKKHVIGPPQQIMIFVQIGAGIMISNNIDADTIKVIISGHLIVPLLISTLVIFGTSFLVAYIVHKITNWNSLECLLAAAPAGFVPMTFLALDLEVDPMKVSLLHLCRIISIKLIVPFIILFW